MKLTYLKFDFTMSWAEATRDILLGIETGNLDP